MVLLVTILLSIMLSLVVLAIGISLKFLLLDFKAKYTFATPTPKETELMR